MNEDRALTDREVNAIEMAFYQGLHNDKDVLALLRTVRIQKDVLQTLFSYWNHVPLRIISTANAVRTATLDGLKKLVGIETPYRE